MLDLPNLSVLIIDPQEKMRTELSTFIRQSRTGKTIREAENLVLGLTALRQEVVQLCYIGQNVPSEDKAAYLHAIAREFPQCALVAVFTAEESETVLTALKAGAHAVLFRPFEERRLERVVISALEAVGEEREEGTSLPWILESVARRLERLAAQVKEEETRSGVSIPSSTDAVKEALLAALVTSGSAQSEYPTEVLLRLKDRSRTN
jgi:DNA-binding NarL/FixJ family response regulator